MLYDNHIFYLTILWNILIRHSIHALFLIRDVAKLPGLLSPNFSRFFRAAVPYLSLIFCPFLYPCVSYDFIKILKFLAASLQNEKSIFCLLLISTLPLASLIFPENSSPVSYWPSLINNNACTTYRWIIVFITYYLWCSVQKMRQMASNRSAHLLVNNTIVCEPPLSTLCLWTQQPSNIWSRTSKQKAFDA